MNASELEHGSVDILMVEDNRADVVLLKKAFEEENATECTLHVTSNGDDALSFLRQQGAFTKAPRPTLILLDLNLPGLDGREVLGDIKSDPELRSIPVIILSSSRSDNDVRACYDLHANAFMTKADDFDELVEVVQQLRSYWLGRVRLPRH